MGGQQEGDLQSGGGWWLQARPPLAPPVRPPAPPSAGCGIQKTNVIETSEEGLVSEKEFPWVVSLQNSHHAHLAFGSILSEFWILSIASAFQHRPVP